jgi:hypothetical protein
MPSFGEKSKAQLETCDIQLQMLFNEVIKYVDCTILEGHRGEEAQNKAFREGKSRKKFPEGKHNSKPSKAVDVMMYPIDWKDTQRQILFAGFVLGMAAKMGIKLTWGGDWDGDFNMKEHSLFDVPHFELN